MLPDIYKKLSERHYKDYTTCQFPGCDKTLDKVKGQRVRKYCSIEHAKQAQKLYIAEWKVTHKGNVKAWNERYVRNVKLKIKQGIYENKEPKTD